MLGFFDRYGYVDTPSVWATAPGEHRLGTTKPSVAGGLSVIGGVGLLGLGAAAVALGAAVGLEYLLAHAERLRRHFDEFVIGDELDGLLEREDLERDEADGVVGA